MKYVFLKTLKLSFVLFGLFAALLLFILTTIIVQFPSDKEIKGCMTTKLYQVNLCAGSAHYARLRQISDYMIKAVVLTEDSSFYQHKGFDFQEIENSFKANLEKGKFARGGSTITQQLAKNLFLSKDKTLQRKIFEAVITLRIEKVLTKSEILEKYLNVVQFGKDLYGIKDAAQFYFKKSPADLTLNESAFLVFLLPSPEKYSRSYFKGELTPFARKRVATIVERLYTYDRITESEYKLAVENRDQFISGGKKDTELNLDEVESDSELELE